MKIVVGIGNPGKAYATTRHNLGFRVVDRLADDHGIAVTRRRFEALVGEGTVGTSRVLLVKPQTYVNLSGQAVAPLLRWHRVPLDDLLVVCDDLALPLGRLRLRRGGSSGGHNGLKSIAESLGGEAFARLRVGIGRPEVPGTFREGSWNLPDATDHVLGRFTAEEHEAVAAAVVRAAAAVRRWLAQGIGAAMNEFNA